MLCRPSSGTPSNPYSGHPDTSVSLSRVRRIPLTVLVFVRGLTLLVLCASFPAGALIAIGWIRSSWYIRIWRWLFPTLLGWKCLFLRLDYCCVLCVPSSIQESLHLFCRSIPPVISVCLAMVWRIHRLQTLPGRRCFPQRHRRLCPRLSFLILLSSSLVVSKEAVDCYGRRSWLIHLIGINCCYGWKPVFRLMTSGRQIPGQSLLYSGPIQ